MKTLLLVLSLLFVGCSTKPVQTSYAVIDTVEVATSMGKSYAAWTGLLEIGEPIGGILVRNHPIDLRVGDVVTIKKHPGDTLWTIKKRINDNR